MLSFISSVVLESGIQPSLADANTKALDRNPESPIRTFGIQESNNDFIRFLKVQRCMSLTEKIVLVKISTKVMHSGKVMSDYMACGPLWVG